MNKQKLLKELKEQRNTEAYYEELNGKLGEPDAKVYHNGRKELLDYIIPLVEKLPDQINIHNIPDMIGGNYNG